MLSAPPVLRKSSRRAYLVSVTYKFLVVVMVPVPASSLVVRGPMTPIDQLVLRGFIIHRPCMRCARAMSRISLKTSGFNEKFQKSLPLILISPYITMFRTGRAVHYALAHSHGNIIPKHNGVALDFGRAKKAFREQDDLFCEDFGDNPLDLKKAEIVDAGLATGFPISDDLLAPFTSYEPHDDETGPSFSVSTDYCHTPADQPLSITALLARILELELCNRQRETTLRQYENRLHILEKRLGIESPIEHQYDIESEDFLLANIDPELFNCE
ncbi:hypothetical protein QBC38DRAFT_460438 [Podospora fimiseda]|uniref:Uncharacterized protein n=1 Tax=Podospora fimiseda TaxID=252190 RepID=A0AAN7BFS1_9PEZI|nr:hypothetical protein QBC38DRAFT_460438 [Podospora fimiseda]